ncbi:hypothetical protein CC80DRAFT_425360, partial [Byssothecium circinans]
MAEADGRPRISNHVEACFIGFRDACARLSEASDTISSKLPSDAISDELGRFRLWCGNVGAHKRGRSSLDYKLREASHIRDRVTNLLENLENILKKTCDLIQGERIPWEDQSDDGSELSFPEDEDEAQTELQQCVSGIAEIITCLMRTSMAIQNPAPHDQIVASERIDKTFFEHYDINHVGGKFPNAPNALIVRLGKAITRRRQYLRYREDHRRKLEHGIVSLLQAYNDDAAGTIAPSEHVQSTVASSIPEEMKQTDFNIGLDDDDDEGEEYEEAHSQTSYATSCAGSTRLKPPPLPKQGSDYKPFECPICFRLTKARNIIAWYSHVYQDLRPYICTFEDCEIPDCSYEARHEWFQHELQAHRRQWECFEGCPGSFPTREGFSEHLQVSHPQLANSKSLDAIMQACERAQRMDTEVECVLCQQQLPSLTKLRRHLGKHHQELALFALSNFVREDEEDNDDASE